MEIPLLLFRQIAHPTDLTLAYQYDRKHPGRAYFPRYPLAEYYAEHRLYHSDGALLDREVTGHGASPAQFASGIPKDVAVIALSKGQPKSGALQNYLAGWPQINDPELPGWVVYQRPSAGGLTPQQ